MSTAPSYYWHDYETFGIDPRRDRPAQFAGLRTDRDFNPIGDPLVLYCQPTEDWLPHPEAVMVTGITPQQARDEGLPEPVFIATILDELAATGTCGIGYNSLRFDDEVTRHTLWRNFHDPYAREWRNGCSRWDLIDTVRLCYALRPEGIEWPRREDGHPSFRLEHLAAANGLEQTRAHDALSDVQATIALARLVRERQPRLFDYAESHRDKASARKLLDLSRFEPVLHVSEKFPAELGCISLVMPITPQPGNSNGVICFDLRHDPAPLLELDAVEIHERLYTPAADLPEGIERVALKTVAVNRSPVLAPVSTLGPAQAERVKLDLDSCRRHWRAIHEHMAEVAAKCAEVYTLGDFEPGSDPEQDLYGGFIGDEDRRLCEQIVAAGLGDLEALTPAFRDPRLQEMWFRFRARHCPHALDEDETQRWAEFVSRRLEFAPDGGLAMAEYRMLVDGMCAHTDEAVRTLGGALREWGEQLAARWLSA